MSKVFGYPDFVNGEQILTQYEGDYAHMKMDIRVFRMKREEECVFQKKEEETAVLLLSGKIRIQTKGIDQAVSRESVFKQGPWCVHVPSRTRLSITAVQESEILVQSTVNQKTFPIRLYSPKDAPYKYSCLNEFENTAKRRVNTIFDHEICPESNMVLGEVLNDPGNWSGYLPHSHPQPECYYFKFDHPEGFGASFVGDKVFKSTDGSFSAIPGGKLHPQACAPGFQMYTCWMIRHLDEKPWLQTDRVEDERYIWLHGKEN